MPIKRDLALKIIKYLLDNPSFYFPFLVMCKGYASDIDEDFVEIVPEDDYENLLEDTQYNTFELWENLQNLNSETLELMTKGFLHKIEHTDILTKISNLATEYRKSWKEELWETTDIEEYGLNEFLGGKAEAYEDCLQIINEYLFAEQVLSTDIIIKELEHLAQVFQTDDGNSINYSEIWQWQKNATSVSINEMSQSILQLIDGKYDFDDEELYLVAELIVLEIKAIVNK